MEVKKNNIYETFAAYNAKAEGDVKKKGNYDYLPWATAWEEVLKVDPTATRTIERDPVTNNYYSAIGNSAVVTVSVTICGQTRTEVYPIESTPMRSTALEKIDASQWNRAVQRGTVKCLAMFGLGLQLYRGEDLTEMERDEISSDILSMIDNATTRDALIVVYNANKDIIDRTPRLLKMFKLKSNELNDKKQ